MKIDVLIPTYNRLSSLILALSGVAAQNHTNLNVIVSDQSEAPAENDPVIQSLRRIIESRGGVTEWHYRKPSHGVAEQRQYLLEKSTADSVLYLDDDVFMEPDVVRKLVEVLTIENCGFVGAFPIGLSFLEDVRPEQQKIEFWNGPVQPEEITPGSEQWERAQLHRAANAYHVAQNMRLKPDAVLRYKVAWVASCVLYDRRKLLEIGGFSFWRELPRYHSGEEVLVQNLLMRRWGGCAILPSGTYHSELPSTVLNSEGTVDGHALELLPAKIKR